MNSKKLWKKFNSFKRRIFVSYTHRSRLTEIKKRLSPQGKALSPDQTKAIKDYYRSFGFKAIRSEWHQYYTDFSGIFDKRYMPSDYFYSTVAYALNNKSYRCLMDKAILDKVFTGIRLPEILFKRVDGSYLIDDRVVSYEEGLAQCQGVENLLVKPSVYSGGGRSVQRLDPKATIAEIRGILDRYGNNFTVQKIVEQHPEMARLNESSFNTIRIHSYLNQDGVHVLTSYIRIGKQGTLVDNMASGGIGVLVHHDGRMDGKGYYKYGTDSVDTTDSGILLNTFVVPHFDKIIKKAKALHQQVPYFKFVAWDIGIDKDSEPVLIEFNLWEQAMDFPQMVDGPLFGDFTDEVLEITRKYVERQRSVSVFP